MPISRLSPSALIVYVLCLSSSVEARAQPAKGGLPPGLEAMLREAHRAERDTVENIAKRLYPAYRQEIDDLIDDIDDAEKARVAHEKVLRGWHGEVSAGASWATGNTRSRGVNLTLDVERKTPNQEHRVTGYLDLASQNGVSNTERWALGYRLRRDFGDSPWFALGSLQYERDRFQGIARRFTEMIGGGYQVIDTDALDLEVSLGPAMRQTRFIDMDNENRFGWAAGAELEYELTDTLKFKETFNAVLDEGNSSFISVTALTSNIYGRISGRVSFTADYESDPSQGAQNLDTRGQVGIELEL